MSNKNDRRNSSNSVGLILVILATALAKKGRTSGTKSEFTSHCQIAAKNALLLVVDPSPFCACSLLFSND